MKFAHQQWGIFMLRIEDTDQQRLVENGIQTIIKGLSDFGIIADEWPWPYGPYIQSERKLIYQTLAKDLIAQGKAYPCFLTAEQIEQTREIQTAGKQLPGIYGDFALYRHKSLDEVRTLIDAGMPFVIRLLCPAHADERVEYIDLIKWPISAQANINDIVLIKSDGLPTYHFAHIVDDYLMGTTHVIRADERVPSVPLHIQLYEATWWWQCRRSYAHVAPLLKSDGGKRKLSKRKDPEADVWFLVQSWYPVDAIKEYLMTIIDSKYEGKSNNQTLTYSDPIKLDQMNASGALVDMSKLESVCREYIASLSSETLYKQVSTRPVENPLSPYRVSHKDIIIKALWIERGDQLKDPKRFVTYKDVVHHLIPFIDQLYDQIDMSMPEWSRDFLNAYIHVLDLSSKEQWFDQLKEIGSKLGYAVNNQEYKTGNYKGKIWDLAMILRVALFKSSQTPDLYESMQVMWIERVKKRLKK